MQYKRTLEGMLFAMLGAAAVAEDLFQEMAVLMTGKREQADERCKFVAWGRQIAVNCFAILFLRRATAPLPGVTTPGGGGGDK